MPITSEHLLVEDADTPADEIVYTLLTAPTNGDVIVDDVGVTSFTQQLINDDRVMFAHRGGPVCLSFLVDLLTSFTYCASLTGRKAPGGFVGVLNLSLIHI